MLQVRHEVQTDNGGRIKYRAFRELGQRHYNIRLYITGEPPSGQTIKKVEYHLHPTFKKPVREGDPNKQFEAYIWTWGMFELKAHVTFNETTDKRILEHELFYRLPPDDGRNYTLE